MVDTYRELYISQQILNGKALYEDFIKDKKYKDWTFEIYGFGPCEQSIKETIKKADSREYSYNVILDYYNQLKDLAKNMDKDGTVIKMKEIVPEFKSKNSRYEKFDK